MIIEMQGFGINWKYKLGKEGGGIFLVMCRDGENWTMRVSVG